MKFKLALAGVAVAAAATLIPATTAGAESPPNTKKFDAQMLAQLQRPEPNGFGAYAVDTVICEIPHNWAVGDVFRCAGLDTTDGLGGIATVTVNADSGGYWHWTTHWNSEQA